MPEFSLHSGYTWWWIAIAVQIFIVETLGMVRPERGDTLTDHIRWLFFNYPVTTGIVGFFLAWLFYHFIIETHL